MGFVAAQDFEAIERRLGGAVEAGEISLEQAHVMMQALRMSAEESHEREARERRYAEFERHIHEELEAGEISEEEAEDRLIDMRRELFDHHDHRAEMEERREHFANVERDLKAVVEAGDIAEEDAMRELEEIHVELFGDHDREHDRDREHDHDREHDRDREYDRSREHDRDHEYDHDRDHDRDVEMAKREEFETAVMKIKKSIEAGKLSEEDAEKKIHALKRSIFEGHNEGKHDDKMEAGRHRFAEVAREVEQAVRAGKLSVEAAKEKLATIKKEMFGGSKKPGKSEMELRKQRFEQVVRRLKALFEEGDITEKEANEKLLQLRKKMLEEEREGEAKRKKANREEKQK